MFVSGSDQDFRSPLNSKIPNLPGKELHWTSTELPSLGVHCSHLPRFFKMLGSDENRAWYGSDHVSLAADRGAIGTLLISDELFR